VDVYGLGAVLYVLLTGRPPFTGATSQEILTAVQEQPPPPPRQLNPAIDLDLQTICLKCLSKEPRERYASAALLADDLEAYANRRPIQARPLSLLKRTAYWCRRQPVLAGLSGSLAASLVVGTALVFYHGYQAQRNFELAEGRLTLVQAEKDRADEHFKLAHKAIVDFSKLIEEDKSTQANHPLQQKSLELTRKYFEDFIRLRADDVELQNEFAETLLNLARINDRLGRSRDALEAVGQAQRVFDSIGKADPDDPAWALKQTDVSNFTAKIVWTGGKSDEARQLVEKDLATVKALRATQPDDGKLLARQAHLELNLGAIHTEALKDDLALRHLNAARELFADLIEKDAKNQNARAGLASTLHNLGALTIQSNQLKAAHEFFHNSTDLRRALAKENPKSTYHLGFFASAMDHEAVTLRALGRKEEAAKANLEALRIRELLARSEPALVRRQVAWVASCRHVAADHRADGRHSEALALYRLAATVLEPLAAKEDATVLIRLDFVRTLATLAAELQFMKQSTEALAVYTKATDRGEVLVAQNPARLDCRGAVAQAYWELGQFHAAANSGESARSALQKNIEHERKRIEQAPKVVSYRKNLSRTYVTLANWDRKELKFADALQRAAARANLWPGNADELFNVAQDLCHTAVQAGAAKSPEAARAWTQCEALVRQSLQAGLAWAKLDSVPIMQAFRQRPAYAELRQEFGVASQNK
jgi:serine/threonine-protein kinase